MMYRVGNRCVRLVGQEHFIAPTAVLIGSVILEDRSSIWFNSVLRADNEPITIGIESNIQDGCVLHTDEGIPLTVGQGVTVGHKALLHGCEIGDCCLIGIASVILNRVKIGRNCLIGAKALITEGKVIPDNSLVLGSPGKVVREVTGEEIRRIRLAAETYVANMRRYLASLRGDDEGEKTLMPDKPFPGQPV
jgi:carbonic anhydrase/acetyltransferase-like protein (isoleucine patch superfamily)